MSEFFWPLFALISGLVVGSFLNVVIHRLPRMMDELEDSAEESSGAADTPPPASGRLTLALPASHCPSCGHRITALQNIPLISYCVLAGACAACGARISARYPIVELLGATAAVISVLVFGPTAQAVSTMIFLWFAIAIAFIDAEHLLVPDTLSLSLLWVGLLCNAFQTHVAPSDAILGAAAGYGLFWGVNAVAERLLGRTASGQGDFKLFAAIGAWFGWQALAPALFVASASGVLIGYTLIWIGLSKKGRPICFAPFLLIGAAAVLFSEGRLLAWLTSGWMY